MCVHKPTEFISGFLLRDSAPHHDPGIQKLICLLTAQSRPGDWMIDLGTNIGVVTLPLLAAGRNVLSFEGNSNNAALVNASWHNLLAKNPAIVGRLVLVNKAVVDYERFAKGGTMCMGWPPRQQRLGINQGAMGASEKGEIEGRICQHEVGVTTMDDAILANGLQSVHWAGMKADCEGCEEGALKGAHRLLCHRPPKLITLEALDRSFLAEWAERYNYNATIPHRPSDDVEYYHAGPAECAHGAHHRWGDRGAHHRNHTR